ncbi:MAG TPA: phage tail protein [Anaerolineaceae bacterium]|nr:phage tail protein [Anaerolineaceae bacterium]
MNMFFEKNDINSKEYQESQVLSLVPDFYNRYPGEEVNLFARLLNSKEFVNSILSVSLPEGLELIEYSVNDPNNNKTFVRDLDAGQVVDWHLGNEVSEQEYLELIIKARVLNPGRLVYLVSFAELVNSKGKLAYNENVRVAVHPTGNYINNLPEIYHDHDLMNRFLMLFESFWKPINQQINQIDLYFDPKFAPVYFLPWLASWLGVVWDETLPDERKRKLLQVAVSMYQRRGTRSSLEEYIKIYTNGGVDIIEHRSQNLVLGKETKLGAAIALGAQNLPHTFTVNVKIGEKELDRMNASDRSRNEIAYFQKLENLITDRKPAHTGFKLNLEIENSKNKEQLVGKDV